MDPQVCIRAKHVRISYGQDEVIHGIDLEVKTGEFVSIVGKSGYGKSTLLYALAGFLASQGEIRTPSKIGFVFQDYAVFPWLTVRRNIEFGLFHLGPDRRRVIADQHLILSGLLDQAEKYPGQLSGGQIQRVALARALAPDPNLLLMDEPFGALDSFTRAKMEEWLHNLWQENPRSAVFVTHSMEEGIYLADRVILMGRGKIVREFDVPFARPRSMAIKFSPAFVELRKELNDALESS